MKVFNPPYRQWIVIVLVSVALVFGLLVKDGGYFLLLAALAGSLNTFWKALRSLFKRKINIDTFNILALVVSFGTGEIQSAAFIVLMLSSADLLDWHSSRRSFKAVEELLSLKPVNASVEKGGKVIEVPVQDIKEGDILISGDGSRIAVDGVVVSGTALINESSVSGESELIKKVSGDRVLGGTLNESGVLKIRATTVGQYSTLERMASLIKEAAKHKSQSEKLADRFAQIFLPIVLAIGIATYLITKNIVMTSAIFLVACADDMALAIPLAMTASIGRAAKKGVIIKGGQWLDALGKLNILVLDKTGTLTYGSLSVENVEIEPGVDTENFWLKLGIAEKFSEHPISRAIVHKSLEVAKNIPDPDDFKIYKGSGVWARYREDEIFVGDESLFEAAGIKIEEHIMSRLNIAREKYGSTTSLVYINRFFSGLISLRDIPRPEARASLSKIIDLGIEKVIMLTGDNKETASRVSEILGIKDFKASMMPEDKIHALQVLLKDNRVGMVGDGINDAPALSLADVGIAMGTSGSAVAVEAADIVILSDDLSRIPDMIVLGRKTNSVIRTDIILWIVSNTLGFALVLTGVAGPALAAFYNFATDFLPLTNSARLFKD